MLYKLGGDNVIKRAIFEITLAISSACKTTSTMFLHEKGSSFRSLGYFVFTIHWIAILSSGSKVNHTQEVANLMGQLFDDSKACNTPTMELGFLVSGSYKESKDKSEMTFRKALRFVRNMAQKAKVSDSGTHIGLVVYGKKPYLAFDFNQYFEISSLSQAIEEVKTPIAGSNLGEALSFTKNQLYDKSARPNIPKTLIVLLSKRSEDAIGHAVKDLKDAGVKILTVGIGGENDPLEMSDSASDIQNTLISDENHLDTLETKLAPKLCRDVIEGSSSQEVTADDSDSAMQTEVTLGDSEAAMNPSEEPDPEIITVTPDETPSEETDTGTISNSPNAINSPKKPNIEENKVHAIRKPIPSHDATNRKEAQVESTSSDDDTFEDAMVNPPSNHSNILDALFESSYRDNRTIEPFRGTSKMYKTETNSIPQNGTSPYDDHDERNESTTNDSSSANMTTESTTESNNKHIALKDLVNKVCSAKADIGILIDGSSSVTEANFAKLLDFTKSLSKSFSVSKDHTHIAVATASRGPRMSFDFEGFNDIPSLDTAISRISYNGGPFLLGSSLTGVKTSWFKNSGRKSIPQLLLVLATASSIDDIAVPSREMRDRGVRIEAVGIGSGFEGGQLKEIATHPAQDHVLAVSKYELLPMIRPLLTFRMCRAVGGKLIARPNSDADPDPDVMVSNSSTAANQTITNEQQPLPGINHVKNDSNVGKEMTVDPTMKQERQPSKLAATLKQLDQYKMICQQKNLENSSTEQQHAIEHNSTATNKSQQDEIEKEKLRKDIRRKLYSLIRRLGGTKKDVRAAYRSIIYNINGHHDTEYCKDHHDLCKQWNTDNLCEKGNDIIDAQSVQRVCPKSCQVCF